MTKYLVFFMPKKGSNLKYPDTEVIINASNKDWLRLKTLEHPLLKKAYAVYYNNMSKPNSRFVGQLYNGPSTSEPLWWEGNVLYRINPQTGALMKFERGILAHPNLRWGYMGQDGYIAKEITPANEPDTTYYLALEKSGDYAVKVWNPKQKRYVRLPQDKIPAWARKRKN